MGPNPYQGPAQAGEAGGGPQRADTLTGTFIVNTKR